jgi:hypothetical protein
MTAKHTLGLVLCGMLASCATATDWKIGADLPKHKILVDAPTPQSVNVCATEFHDVGFPLWLVVIYDGQRYAELKPGKCHTFMAKKVEVTFATQTSFKWATGTYSIKK